MGLLVLLSAGCQPDFARESNLSKPRVLAIKLDKPVVRVGETATASILLYDPTWRKPVIHWALALNPLPVEALRRNYGDPATLAMEDGFLYLGQGTMVTVTIPPLPKLEEQLTSFGIEQFALPLVAFVDWPDGQRLLAFKQVKITSPFAVQKLLTATTSPTALTEAVRERIAFLNNHNPVAGPPLFSSRQKPFSAEERTWLAKRKAAAFVADSLQTVAGGAIRVQWPVTDVDNTNLQRGDEGYNIVEASFYLEEAMRYPLTRTAADLVLEHFRQSSAFAEPKYIPFGKGIYQGCMVVTDRKGGLSWRLFNVDVESDPPDNLPTLDRVALLRSGNLLFWQPFTAGAALLLTNTTTVYELQGTLAQRTTHSAGGLPLYVEAATVAVTDVTGLRFPEELLGDLVTLHDSYGLPVSWPVKLLRWE